MSKPFEREARYVVLKGTDIAQFLTEQEQHRLKNLMATVAQWRVKSGKAPLDVFVLEKDWPEFDIAVDMVRRRMEGLPTREAETKRLQDQFLSEELHKKTMEIREIAEDRDNWLKAVQEMVRLILEGSSIMGELSARPAVALLFKFLNQQDDYRTKSDAVIREVKEKLMAANDIAETVFKLATNAPELNRSDIDHDAACQLDAAMIEIYGILKSYLVGGPCATCGGSGSIGGCSGQTPESYQEETYPCPDCAENTVTPSSGTRKAVSIVTGNSSEVDALLTQDGAGRILSLNARQPGMQTMRDLAMLVKQLCRGYLIGTRKLDDDRLLATRAMDYLKRKGLDGSPLREGEGSKPWVTEWNAKVPRYTFVAKADGAYPRETADGKYVLWTDHFAKLQELLKDHGDAALQEIDRLLNENVELKADRDKWQGKAHALNQEMITLTANISRLRRVLAPYAQESEWSHATGADQWRLLFNSTDRDGHGYERAQAALLLTEPKDATTAVSPMSTAPRDGTEILAYHIDGKSYHPVFSHGDHWGMRWNDEYYCGDGCYSGWIPYPKGGN